MSTSLKCPPYRFGHLNVTREAFIQRCQVSEQPLALIQRPLQLSQRISVLARGVAELVQAKLIGGCGIAIGNTEHAAQEIV
jgi:hypothetical protein